jgi:hypothetical protein
LKRKILISSLDPGCEEFFMDCNCSLEKVEFTPLEERVKAEDPELFNGLSELKAGMSGSDFEKYINSLTSMKKHGDTMFLITRNAMYKSVIELKFIKQIAESFEVSGVRLIVLPF